MVPKTYKILLVEDSEVHAELIRESLLSWKAGLRLDVVTSLAAARAYLADHAPDFALIDFMLPDGKGTDLLSLERKKGEFPAVLLTASGDEQTAVEAMKSGALDYLVKDAATLSELPRIVERTLREWSNIVSRRQAEEALRRSEEKYRRLFANMREAVAVDRVIYDENGRVADWVVTDLNPAYEKVFGINRQTAIGQRASALYSSFLDLEPLLQTVTRVIETGRSEQLEYFYPLSLKHILVSFFTMGDGYFATLTRDMTERRRMEEELRRLLAEQEATLNAIADAVIIYDSDGRIRHMNPAAERLFGYSPEDRLMPIAERISRFKIETPDGRPFPLEDLLRRAVAGERIKEAVLAFRRSEGREVWLSCSAAPFYTEDGQRVGVVGTYTDITSLHELQKERDLYLHTISHDLRTPLTVVQGYGQLLREALEKERAGASLGMMCDEVLKGTQRMKRMIDALVDLARLEGGQVEPKASTLLLGSFVQQLVVRLERLRLKGVLDTGRLTIDIPPSLPPVLADPDLLERILLNLLTNAMKYSAPETPVTLEARRNKGEVEIAVIDQGEGIARKDQPHIFERFYRPGEHRREDSVGLGLYITRKLVEVHGGRIWVESDPGRGSTFFFTLPVSGLAASAKE
jgi:PAS domain S-box-containing protein